MGGAELDIVPLHDFLQFVFFCSQKNYFIHFLDQRVESPQLGAAGVAAARGSYLDVAQAVLSLQ